MDTYSGATTVDVTDAEIDAATGSTPAAKGAGYLAWLEDTTFGRVFLFGTPDGTNWYWVQMNLGQ